MDLPNGPRSHRAAFVLVCSIVGAAFGMAIPCGSGGDAPSIAFALPATVGAIAAFVISSLSLYATADRRRSYSWKSQLIVVPFFVLLLTWLVSAIYPLVRHGQASERMGTAITKLSIQTPPELTDDQWAYCIFHTWNLHANYGGAPSYVPTADLERIERELQVRIERGPDVETIDWLWDQYMQSYPRARNYERYRPTATANRAEFDDPRGYEPLSWWRSEYHRRTGTVP